MDAASGELPGFGGALRVGLGRAVRPSTDHRLGPKVVPVDHPVGPFRHDDVIFALGLVDASLALLEHILRESCTAGMASSRSRAVVVTLMAAPFLAAGDAAP